MINADTATNLTAQNPWRWKSTGWLLPFLLWIFCLPTVQLFSQTEQASSRRALDSSSIQSASVTATDIEVLVRQLGADDYASRKIAETELRSNGGASIEPLRRALLSTETVFDNEVRMRAERLLIEIQREEFKRRIRDFLAAENNDKTDFGFAGWRQFATIVGDQKVARRMYIRMYRAHEQLFRSLEMRRNSFNQAFRTASTTSLRKRTNAGRKLDTLNCLMFLSSASIAAGIGNERNETATPVRVKPQTRSLIASQLNRPEMVTYVNSCHNRPEIEKLIDFWLRQSTEDDLSFVNLRVTIIENYRLATQSDFLATVALANELPIQTRVRAIETLVPLAKPESVASLIERLDPLLDDSGLVGRFPPPDSGQILDVEFRDLVLAAAVTLVNEDPAEYGFQFPQSSAKSVDRTRCGFANRKLSEQAIKKWRDSRSELPNPPDC